jgi:hypothetical protein
MSDDLLFPFFQFERPAFPFGVSPARYSLVLWSEAADSAVIGYTVVAYCAGSASCVN